MRRKRSNTQIRLWVLMLAAFAIVGGCATISIAGFTLARYEDDSRDQTLALSRVVALQVSPSRDSALSPADLAGYHAANDLLRQVRRQAGSIRRIFTLRKDSGRYETVLDTTVDPRKPLPTTIFNPTPGLDRTAKDVFESAVAQVDQEIVTDRAGPYFTAYAPVIDSTGHVVEVLGIDRDATDIASHVDSVKGGAALVFGMVFLLGSVFSRIIVRQLARGAQSEAWLRGTITSARILRATILELVLAGLAVAVLGMGVYSQIRTSQLRLDENASMDRTKTYDQYRVRIERVLRDHRADPSGMTILTDAASRGGLDWLAGSLTNEGRNTVSEWQEPLWQGLVAIKKKTESERNAREQIKAQITDMNERLNAALALAILLSFGVPCSGPRGRKAAAGTAHRQTRQSSPPGCV